MKSTQTDDGACCPTLTSGVWSSSNARLPSPVCDTWKQPSRSIFAEPRDNLQLDFNAIPSCSSIVNDALEIQRVSSLPATA